MELEFPIDFVVQGTAVSVQAESRSKARWMETVKQASLDAIDPPKFSSDENMSVTLYYFSDGPKQVDTDNIIKPILDALAPQIYQDDRQVDRVTAHQFEPENLFMFSNPSEAFSRALEMERPVLYVRISNNPSEDLK